MISFGSSAMSALSAVRRARREGIKAGMLRLKTMWPFPDALVAEAASHAKRIIVPEMNLGQLSLLLRGTYLVDARSVSKVAGQPFTAAELTVEIEKVLS